MIQYEKGMRKDRRMAVAIAGLIGVLVGALLVTIILIYAFGMRSKRKTTPFVGA